MILRDRSRFNLCYTRYHKIRSVLHNLATNILTLQDLPGSSEDFVVEDLA